MATVGEALSAELETRRAVLPIEDRRRLRRAAGLPLQAIADACGVSRETIHLWETGKRAPRGENLRAYAEVMRMLREEVERGAP